MKELIHSVFDRLGIETNRSTTLRRFFKEHPIDLVVDAGANLGQFAHSVRKKGYSGRIWSFEPVSSIFSVLLRNSSADPNWKVSQYALGATPGELQINVPANHSLASFLHPSELLSSFDSTGVLEHESVQVRTLDEVLATDQAESIFLKADVQGFEKQVLEGARQAMKRVYAIYLELPIEHIYHGNWTFVEAISYLDNLGFTPAQFRTVNTLPNKRAFAIEFDCLFRRK